MSISPSSVVIKPAGNDFWDRLPDDAVRSIFEFLKGDESSLPLSSHRDERSIIGTSAVCRKWQSDVVLRDERIEASQRLRLKNVHIEMRGNAYSPALRQIFRECNIPIGKLPVLKLNRDSDYIDWLNPEDLSHPVMRFTDLRNRPGIAFSLQHRTQPPIAPLLHHLMEQLPEEERIALMQQQPLPTEVLTIFKRNPTPDSHWTFGNNRGIESRTPNAFPEGHLVNSAFIQQLLTNQHPLYRIA